MTTKNVTWEKIEDGLSDGEVYRITWYHEVYIRAKNPQELKDKWESLPLGELEEMVRKGEILSHDYCDMGEVTDKQYKQVYWR